MRDRYTIYQNLRPAGNGLYETKDAAVPAQDTKMIQGKIEGSNVQPVTEMTRMISVSRDYQAMQNVMQNEHDKLRNAIQRIMRTG